jgi:hypothetical protein
LNSIDLGATRGDLAERMLPVTLDPIPETERLPESEIWPRWDQDHPRILGALLDVAVRVARVASQQSGPSKGALPRMADFALTLIAVDQVLGTTGLAHYLGKQTALAADSLTGDPFIVELAKRTGGIEGTAAEILAALRVEHPPRDWPRSARSVTQRLRRHSPAMRRADWRVDHDGAANHANVVRWTICPPERPEISRKQSSQSSQPASYARVARVENGQTPDVQAIAARIAADRRLP